MPCTLLDIERLIDGSVKVDHEVNAQAAHIVQHAEARAACPGDVVVNNELIDLPLQEFELPVAPASLFDLAIAQAGTTNADKVREALEDLKAPYAGLIKTYTRPFSRDNHDALGSSDYVMVRYDGNRIVPAQ